MRSLWRRLEICLEQHLAHGGRRNRDPETLELADDPFVSPVRVLPSETKDQIAERALEPRSPRPPLRVCPPARDQLAVPAKQRLRPEREGQPARPRERAAQRREQRSIRSCQRRPRGLAAEDRQLMAEDEDLQLLRSTRTPQQPHQREQVPDNEIHERPEQAASLDHGKSVEPSEPGNSRSRGRVCEPYAIGARASLGARGGPTLRDSVPRLRLSVRD
jgi:hypothetical protein